MKQPSEDALKLIFEYEVGGGESYYNKYLQHPTWPGGHSGLTLGIGIDCGYYTQKELANLFSFLSAEQLTIVKNASGKVGENARTYVRSDAVKKANISVNWEQAVKLFDELTWPKYARLTDLAFPGADQLKDNAYGALVSLVFNRGSSLKGDSRTEMRNIRDLIPSKNYAGIANELRKMKRIWEGKGLDGLIARREAEAKLVETCI